jgi:hypothetical protein
MRLVHVDVEHGTSEILRTKIQLGGLIGTESQCWLCMIIVTPRLLKQSSADGLTECANRY